MLLEAVPDNGLPVLVLPVLVLLVLVLPVLVLPALVLPALVLPALVRSTGELIRRESEEPKTKKESEREEK